MGLLILWAVIDRPLQLEKAFDFSSAVHERIHVHSNPIEQREVEVGQRRSLFIPYVPPALQTGSRSARDKDGKVIVIVKAGIAHAAAVQINRVVQQRTVTIWCGFQFLE